MTNDSSNQTLVLNLLRGAVPERAHEIGRLWSEHGHSVEVAQSAKGITMNATRKRIKFDTKTIDFFWLLGFSACRSLEVYSPTIWYATLTGISINDALEIDQARGQFEFDYRQRIASAKALLDTAQTANIAWPADVPNPTDDREGLGDIRNIAAFDLVALALAFTLLHEFRHVMLRASEGTPAPEPEEEIACDSWAREFMTSNLAKYAKGHSHSYAQVEQKRAAGIALAAVIVHAMTPSHAHWGTAEYPPIADRLTAMIAGYNLSADSWFWTFTACLLIALMRQDGRPLDIVAVTNKELVKILLERLR